MTFDWDSSAKVEDGHRRSQVTAPNSGFLPPENAHLRFQPIQTKFSHMTFDWNSVSEFENGHHKSHVTPLIGGSSAPLKLNIPPISTNPNQIVTHDF